MSLIVIALVIVTFAFAWSMGAHYTAACMGMPYAAKTIRLRPALVLMAIFPLIGATFLSQAVLTTVGHGIVRAPTISVGAALCVVRLCTDDLLQPVADPDLDHPDSRVLSGRGRHFARSADSLGHD